MQERIEKISISDAHVPDWMQTLREGGFSDKEIDDILSHLNETYREVKIKEYIEQELRKMNEEIKKRRGSGFTPVELENVRKGIESRFGKKSK